MAPEETRAHYSTGHDRYGNRVTWSRHAADPSRFYDPRLVECLAVEGFYQRLFGS
jgi:hypothetical protein